MTYLPDDLIDPVEARLMRSVRGYTESAIVPIDAMAIATAAGAAARGRGRQRSGLFGRFAGRLVLAGATIGLAVAAIGVVIGPGTQPTATGAAPTLDAFGLPGDACPINKLGAAISSWDGAAGSRIAHVALTNFGQTACAMPSVVQVNLVDDHSSTLITGDPMNHWTWVRIGAGQVVSTLVETSNYCGAPAVEPVRLAFQFPLDNQIQSTPASKPGSDSGVPPCNGPSQPAHIEMQPWAAGAGGKLTPIVLPPTGPRTCTFRDVDAVITNWSGAAGSRIATVELHPVGPDVCFVNSLSKVDLVGFVGGTLTPLIVGAPATGSPIELKPGAVLSTLVDVSNYCGPDPEGPVNLAFGKSVADVNGFFATPLSQTDTTGVPPCNGASQPAHIEMRPWSRTAY